MKNILKIVRILLALTVFQAVNLNVYSSGNEQKEAVVLHQKANQALKIKDYKEAAKIFGDITYQYPYYKFAEKVQVMEIYSYLMDRDYDNALSAIENFLKLYPASPYIPYIYYVKALSYYEQIDIPERDQSVTEDAKRALTELITRFPNSEYARDAKLKLKFAEDHLAGQEMVVGRYYLDKGNFVSAINRFKVVAENYKSSSHIQEALYRLVECYSFLGIQSESKKYMSILAKHYPKSQWYRDSLNISRG